MKRLLQLVLLMLLTQPLWASRQFTVGWEEGTGSINLVQWATNQVGGVTTSPVRSGVYAGSFVRATSGVAYHRFNLASSVTSGTYFTRVALRIPSAPSANVKVISIFGGAEAAYFQIATDRTTKLVCVSDSSEITGPTFSVDTWYVVEIRIVISDTVGELELRIGGASQGSLTSKDTLPTNVQFWYIGLTSTVTTATIYADDFALNSAAGSFETSWPTTGGKISLLEPAADVTNQWLDETAGASTFANLTDLPGTPDDATSYNYTASLGNTDRFDVGTLHAEVPSNATFHVLQAYVRDASDSASAARYNIRVWDEGASTTDGGTISANQTSWNPIEPTLTDVVDISAKTKANIEAHDLGVVSTDDNTQERRITILWANVEWSAAAGGKTVSSGSISGGSIQ